MLERGTWFKFLPFEWSVRVPMIASGPNMVRGKIEKHYTSLVDLYQHLLTWQQMKKIMNIQTI